MNISLLRKKIPPRKHGRIEAVFPLMHKAFPDHATFPSEQKSSEKYGFFGIGLLLVVDRAEFQPDSRKIQQNTYHSPLEKAKSKHHSMHHRYHKNQYNGDGCGSTGHNT